MKKGAIIAAPVLVLPVLAATVLVLTACAGRHEGMRNYFAMGTVCTINAYEDGTAALYEAAGRRLDEIEAVFNAQDPGSELSRLNAGAGGPPVTVSAELFFVLEQALFFARETRGAFDPTVGPAAALWGISTEAPRVPAAEEIAALLPFVDYRVVALDPAARAVSLPAGVGLDFGGIAKGYAADCIASLFTEKGVRRGIIDLGGNIFVYGTKKDGSKWRVGVKDPENSRGDAALRLEVEGNSTVVTSGAYERFFEEDGIIYHHIIDPATGWPAETGLLSATIAANSSLAADALSTACYVLGRDETARLFPNGFTAGGVRAEMVLIGTDKRLWVSPGLRDAVTVLAGGYGY